MSRGDSKAYVRLDSADVSHAVAVTGGSEVSPFEQIRREGPSGEYWSARELMPLCGYSSWQKFKGNIIRAMRGFARSTGVAETDASVTSVFILTDNVNRHYHRRQDRQFLCCGNQAQPVSLLLACLRAEFRRGVLRGELSLALGAG